MNHRLARLTLIPAGAEGWRVDDVVLRDGTTLSKLLREAKR